MSDEISRAVKNAGGRHIVAVSKTVEPDQIDDLAEAVKASSDSSRYLKDISARRAKSPEESKIGLWVILVLLVALVVVYFWANPIQRRSRPVTNWITYTKFSQLQTGMDYNRVCYVLGSTGKQLVGGGIGNLTADKFVWENDDGSSVTCGFINNQLVVKEQAGLR